MELLQKGFLQNYSLKFNSIELKYKKATFYNYVEETIPFDQLVLSRYTITRLINTNTLLVLGGIGFSLIIGLILLTESTPANRDGNMFTAGVFFVASIVGIVYALQEYRIKVFLYTSKGTAITFLRNKPDSESVSDFIESLRAKQKEYYVSKYGKIDRALPVEPQLNKITWLLENNFLTDEEFEEKKNTLLRNGSEGRIGFIHN